MSTPKRRSYSFQGIGVSPGIAVGPAFVIEPPSMPAEGHHLAPEEIPGEIARFEAAVEMAKAEIIDIGRRVSEIVDPQQAAIFDAHQSMLADPMMIERTIARIREERMNAEYLFWSVVKAIGNQLKAIGDEYLSERNHDLYDVARRVTKFLGQLGSAKKQTPRAGSIVVAYDLGPSEMAELQAAGAIAFCTDTGGQTSHTAILAKSLGVPAVVGVDLLTHYVRSGDILAIDGRTGQVHLHPEETRLTEFAGLKEARDRTVEALAELRDLPAVTKDNIRIVLEANIEFPNEIDFALKNGAEGIGLYRTEYLFLEGKFPPDEERQRAAYRQVLERVSGPVTIRTLDLGGDKISDSPLHSNEANPFLGLRAVRLCLAYPELFRAQLRPLLRAGAGCELNLMLPMISCLEEIERSRAIVEEVRNQLAAAGEAVPQKVHIGIMVEIPSAALLADALAPHCDFLSIGTNDLTQYALAVDRVSKTVHHLYQPLHPAVLRMIDMVVRAGAEHDTPVSVCGEMAGDVLPAMLLVGLGVRELSMTPGSIGAVKQAIRNMTVADAEPIARQALKAASATEVIALLESTFGSA